ncbi:MAG: phage major capsid protein [Prevotella sp.]|nr:phage major capsid protein [Prevotella sp.]
MKDFKTMTFDELAAARREANDKLGDLYLKAANRELKEDEKQTELNLSRELKQINEAMQTLNRENEHEKAMGEHRQEALGAQFRELLKDCRTNPGKAQREILLAPGSNSDGSSNVTANIEASGAIRLTIHDLIPTLHEGLGLPETLNIITGVTGNEIWPVSINDVEMEEVGEVEALSDQVLNFANITPVVRRIGLTVPVSNMAIDNAAFDLMAFVQSKFEIAFREYFAKKIYSRAEWSGNKGAFSNLAPIGVITLGSGNEYKQILEAVARFSDKGFFEGEVCLSMDRVTEAQLMATPKIKGAAGGFVIENGRCCGYRYTVSHFVNTELNASGQLVAGKGRYLEIGYYEWFAAQTHGGVRLTIDATSSSVAKRNLTSICMNLAASLTDLSVFINGTGGTTQAFACYAVMDADTPQVLASQHAVTVAKNGSKTVPAICNVAGAVITYAVTTALSGVSVTNAGVISAGTTAGTAVVTVTATLPDDSTVTDTITVTVPA